MPTTSAIGPHTAAFLLSARGREAAHGLRDADLTDTHLPRLLDALRRRCTPEEAGALVTLARLRRRAAAKFPDAEKLFFTDEALQQATAAEVAQQHADWLHRHAAPGPLLDLGCGIGGDLLALAAQRSVIAYELDPVRAAFAAANAAARGLGDRVEVRARDWTHDLAAGLLPPAAGAFADPSRRIEERRVFHLDQMQPPLSALLALQANTPLLGVKVMPGVDAAELPENCGVEFVGHAGQCKEAVLWFAAAAWRPRWAALVAGAEVERIPGDETPPPLGPLAPGQVLYEPHPALIRAGALGWLCARFDAHLFDPEIAYLAGAAWQPSPYAEAFAVEEVHPFALKLLNRRLSALGVARVELKKRGFPVEPETLRPRLKLHQEGRAATVLFSRLAGGGRDEHIMIIGRRLGSAPQHDAGKREGESSDAGPGSG
jgi:SAM-dependent methyltransferase